MLSNNRRKKETNCNDSWSIHSKDNTNENHGHLSHRYVNKIHMSKGCNNVTYNKDVKMSSH